MFPCLVLMLRVLSSTCVAAFDSPHLSVVALLLVARLDV